MFGPPRLFATEKFESYNAVMRNAALHTNRQAPSRDISRRFSTFKSIRHFVSGGYWRQQGSWIRAGESIRYLLKDKTVKEIFSFPEDDGTR